MVKRIFVVTLAFCFCTTILCSNALSIEQQSRAVRKNTAQNEIIKEQIIRTIEEITYVLKNEVDTTQAECQREMFAILFNGILFVKASIDYLETSGTMELIGLVTYIYYLVKSFTAFQECTGSAP